MTAEARTLLDRSRILQAVRRFFIERGYVEVETPVRISQPALETHIDAEPSGAMYLRTSPELHMKRLLARGLGRIFQIGPCFRKGERGDRHSPEFTMLEWYRAGADYLDMLAETKALFGFVLSEVRGRVSAPYQGVMVDFGPVWDCLKVSECFLWNAGWDPVERFDADRFFEDLVTKVEPSFVPSRPTVLIDFPAQAAAFARLKSADPRVAERWELYAGGMEIANAFSELTDAGEYRKRFAAAAAERAAAGREAYAMDEDFLREIDGRLPPAGGVALGMDRLVMLLCDECSIERVRAFG